MTYIAIDSRPLRIYPTAERYDMQQLTRRTLLRRTAAAGLATTAPKLFAQPATLDTERSAGVLIKPQTQRAIDRGLAWLAARQDSDGSFGGSGYSRNVSVVSL